MGQKRRMWATARTTATIATMAEYTLSPLFIGQKMSLFFFFFLNKKRLFIAFSSSLNVNDFNLCLGTILTTDLKLMLSIFLIHLFLIEG